MLVYKNEYPNSVSLGSLNKTAKKKCVIKKFFLHAELSVLILIYCSFYLDSSYSDSVRLKYITVFYSTKSSKLWDDHSCQIFVCRAWLSFRTHFEHGVPGFKYLYSSSV